MSTTIAFHSYLRHTHYVEFTTWIYKIQLVLSFAILLTMLFIRHFVVDAFFTSLFLLLFSRRILVALLFLVAVRILFFVFVLVTYFSSLTVLVTRPVAFNSRSLLMLFSSCYFRCSLSLHYSPLTYFILVRRLQC